MRTLSILFLSTFVAFGQAFSPNDPHGPDQPVAGGGAYNPATDVSVVEWLKADALGLSDGASVSTWTHSTGVDALQASGVLQPIFHTAQQNSLPAVQFLSGGGNNPRMSVATFGTIAQPDCVWVVCKFGTTGLRCAFDGVGGSNRQIWYINTSVWDAYANTDTSCGTADTSWHTVKIVFNGASSKVRIDHGTDQTVNAGASSLVGLTLGNFNDGSLNSDCFIGEIIVQNAAPANEEAIWTYLQGRWATY